MATTYTITVESLSKGVERFDDTISEDLRASLAALEKDEEFNLGPRVGTRKEDDWDEYGGTRYYYYHNGRITVRTRYKQLTYHQRTGGRRF
jgi:hypothetical protein